MKKKEVRDQQTYDAGVGGACGAAPGLVGLAGDLNESTQGTWCQRYKQTTSVSSELGRRGSSPLMIQVGERDGGRRYMNAQGNRK